MINRRIARIWDLPLRLWHWSLALAVSISLYTGLSGDIGLMRLHQLVGIAVVGLLFFRLCWFIWGGVYARFRHYRTSPRQVLGYFQGSFELSTHTPPGVVLVIVLLAALLVQSITGLATTDLIFNEGPLTRYVSEEVAQLATAAHHRVFWVVVGCISVHLCAHVIYLVQKNPLPLTMFKGTKFVAVSDTPNYWIRAILTVFAGGVVTLVLLNV